MHQYSSEDGAVAVAASESTPDQCVPQTRQVARLGPLVLDVRLGCDVCLVLGPDYLRPFINWIGVATVCCLDDGFSLTVVLIL